VRSPSLPTAALAGALAACAGDIRPSDFQLDGPPSDAFTPTGLVTTGQNADGTFTTIIDATSASEWTHVDFDARAAAEAGGPWEVRYQRFHISVNGGVTGPGGVEVVPITGRLFDEVTAAPAGGWLADAPDGDDPGFDPDYAFEQGDGWYTYDFDRHLLTPRPHVWVVRSPSGATVKIKIERYYDAAGTPGWVTLRWKPL
jgi:hypothetical protein